MASIGFSVGGVVAGAAIGGPVGAAIGGAIGSVAGSMLDSYVIFPTLFPTAATRQGRLSEFQYNTASEGSPISYCMGPSCRVGGTFIWCSDLIEESKIERADSGGKGPSAKIEQFKYYVSIAIALCENQISKVKKVWADGKLFYSEEPDWSITSDEITFTRSAMTLLPYSGVIMTRVVQEIRIPDSLIDIDKLRFSETITISGASLARNNGVKRIYQVNHDESANEFVVVIKDTDCETEDSGSSITITGETQTFSKEKADDVRIYTGTQDQEPDTLIESYVGAGDVPSYRGMSYVVFEKLALESFGNRLPQFAFLVEADTSLTRAAAIGRILERGGLESTDYDTSYVTGDLEGYVLSGPTTTRDALTPILLAYDIMVQESDGILRFYPRSLLSLVSPVDADDLAAQETGSEPLHPAEIKEISGYSLPSEVNIRYLDPQTDYQPASQSERNQAAPVESVSSIELPLVLTGTEAREIAARILWDSWSRRHVVEGVRLPPTYLDVEESDLIRIPAYGQNLDVRVIEVARGHNGIMEIRGAVERTQEISRTADDPQEYDRSTGIVAGVDLEVIDVAPLRDQDASTPGYYACAAQAEPTGSWRGATLFQSLDGTDFEAQSVVTRPTIMGEIVSSEVLDDRIIDNDTDTTHGVFTSGQSWLLTDVGNPYGGSARVSARVQYSAGYYFWGIALPTGGQYEVLARFTAGADRSQNATYQITHSGGVSYVYVDQSDERLSNTWISLGAYTFGTSGDVILYQSFDGSVCADAIRLLGVATTPGLGDGPVGYWDRLNTVTVRVRGGQLQSHSEMDVLEGKNHALVGGEVIAFQTATVVSENVYQLSTILRGLRGTESLVDSHGALERFVMLDPSALTFQPVNLKAVGQPSFIKAVAPGEAADDVSAQEMTLRARTIYPFPPAHLRAERRVVAVWGDGLYISWQIRTRKIVNILRSDWRLYAEADSLGYQIRIFNSDGQRVRTINTLGMNFFYSNAQQSSDGIASSETITIQAFKFGEEIGLGLPSTITATSTV